MVAFPPAPGPPDVSETSSPDARPAPPSADVFLRAALRSQLLDRARLATLRSENPTADGRELADLLIDAGDLTHYQAEKLLQGLWQGLVLGPYQILAPLGKGGMGTVYLARVFGEGGSAEGETGRRGEGKENNGASVSPPLPHSPSPTLVALKVLPAKRAQEEKMLLRFRREIELNRHVEHPNITRTFDAGEINGVHYIAMEYIPGLSLRQTVTRSGPLEAPVAARVFADVAAGLAHAHTRGLVHRDLKPSNVMVTLEGQAKILDLGLALLMGETLPTDPTVVGGHGYILGTMDYIAPEQTTDATDVGPWSDLYSLGCSLYFALTGVPPFPGGTALQKIRWHRSDDPPPISSINPAVPEPFVRIVERLMAKHPAERPASAEAVRDLLLPWAAPAPGTPLELPHTDRETVAEFDTRAVDPSLWDADPVPVPAPTPQPPPATEPPVARRGVPAAFVVAGLFAGIALLLLLFGLLRRL